MSWITWMDSGKWCFLWGFRLPNSFTGHIYHVYLSVCTK